MPKNNPDEARIKVAGKRFQRSVSVAIEDEEVAGLHEFAQRLSVVANLAARGGHDPVARALGETALAMDPGNVRTANTLMQMYFRNDDYERVIDLGRHQVSPETRLELAEVSSIARLFVGLAEIGIAGDREEGWEVHLQTGCKHALLAYQVWISQAKPADRTSIVFSLGRLLVMGSNVDALDTVRGVIEEVLKFAERQGTWNRSPLSLDDVKEAADSLTADNKVEPPWS